MLGLTSSTFLRDVADNKFSSKRPAPMAVMIVPIFFISILYFIVHLAPEDETVDEGPLRCEGAIEIDALSLECLEIQLFRSWRRAQVDGPEFNETLADLERLAQDRLVDHMNSNSDIELGEAVPLVSFGSEGQFDNKTFNESRIAKNPSARRLMDTQADMRARLDKLQSQSQARHQAFEEEAQKRHQAFLEKFDKMEHDALEAIHQPRQESAFSKSVKAMMEDFDTRQAKLSSTKRTKAEARRARLNHLFNSTLSAIKDKSHTNEYVEHLQKIQDHFEALKKRSPAHRHALHNTSEELAAHKAKLEANQEKMSHDHQEWQAGFDANAADYLTHLCAEEPRRSYPACAKFVAGEASRAASKGAVSSEAPKATSGFLAKDAGLSWSGLMSSLKQGSDSKGLSKGLIGVERNQLRSQKWQGKLPSVACIVAIPSGSNAEAQIKHVIENFRAQSYEGQRQLVMLYRAPASSTPDAATTADSEVEAIVRKHADGTLIKGVAARSHGEFPSTTALRFAAWETDADVIARWNFDEWYHADRLSMQVRALALTSRPVSLLKSWTVLGSENASSASMLLSDEIGWESSIAGEAAWMKSHWMPLLYHERQVLGGTQAHSVVQVDMPELSTYIMDAGSWQGALSHFGLANHTAHSSGMPQACLQTFGTGEHHAHVKPEIVDEADFELADMYHALAGNHADVDEHLRLLCDEVSATKEPLQRDMLVAQVEQIAAVQKQLAGHSATLKDILHDADFESEPDLEL